MDTETSDKNVDISSSCWFVRPDDTKSHKKNKTGPCRRWGHSSAIFDNKIMIYGGTGYTSNPRHWENIYQLELDTWDWNKLESMLIRLHQLEIHIRVQFTKINYTSLEVVVALIQKMI